MDGIRRSDISPNISITDSAAQEQNNQTTLKPNGLIDIGDEIEQAQTIRAPDWTSGNEHDPGITTLELNSFLSESILYRADQISQKSPKLPSVAAQLAKPFYQDALQSMKGGDPSKDSILIQDKLSGIGDSTNYAVLGNLNNADIEALCFLVLMQAAKSAQEDLKAIMSEVKGINEAKAAFRQVAGEIKSDSASETPRRFLSAISDALKLYEAKLSSDDDDPD